MGIANIIGDSRANWRRCRPAKPESLRVQKDSCGVELPADYLTFLSLSDGGEGELPVEPMWFQIWSADKVIENNKSYEIRKNIPGFCGFGSNGAGELFAFDARATQPWKIVAVPFIPMRPEEAILVAGDFLSFVRLMGRKSDWKQ
jgi:hypothetical protein